MNPAREFKKLADELEEAVDLPPRIIRKEIMVPTIIDICPTCNKEIGEKEVFASDIKTEPTIWKHGPCGGLMRSSKEAEEEAAEFLGNFFNTPS